MTEYLKSQWGKASGAVKIVLLTMLSFVLLFLTVTLSVSFARGGSQANSVLSLVVPDDVAVDCAANVEPGEAPYSKILFLSEAGEEVSFYITALEARGHEVVHDTGSYGRSLSTTQITELASYDLIVFSPGTASADYASAPIWNSLPLPILLLNPELALPEHWDWLSADRLKRTIKSFRIVEPNDDLFRNVSAIAEPPVGDPDAGSLHLSYDPEMWLPKVDSAGNGDILGQEDKNGGPMVWAARWSAFSVFYDGSASMAGGERLFLALPQVDYDGLSEDGQLLFDNAVRSLLPPSPTGEAEAYSTCDSGPVTIQYIDNPSGACPLQIERIWTAGDGCGNEATATQLIYLVDVNAPVIEYMPADVSVSCGADLSPSALGAPEANDNCNLPVSYEYTDLPSTLCADSYDIQRIWTISDACGNPTTAVQLISVRDNLAPTITWSRGDVTVGCHADTSPDALGWVRAEDNCDEDVTVTYEDEVLPGSCVSDYEIHRTWAAEDNCQNKTYAYQVISAVNMTAPVFTFVPESVELAGSGIDTSTGALGVAVAVDDCDTNVLVVYEDTVVPGASAAEYTIERIWRAVDQCGNEQSVVQIIQVTDEDQFPVPGPVEITFEVDGEDVGNKAEVGDEVVIRGIIQNTGTNPVSDYLVRVYLDTVEVYSETHTASLAPGASIVVTNIFNALSEEFVFVEITVEEVTAPAVSARTRSRASSSRRAPTSGDSFVRSLERPLRVGGVAANIRIQDIQFRNLTGDDLNILGENCSLQMTATVVYEVFKVLNQGQPGEVMLYNAGEPVRGGFATFEVLGEVSRQTRTGTEGELSVQFFGPASSTNDYLAFIAVTDSSVLGEEQISFNISTLTEPCPQDPNTPDLEILACDIAIGGVTSDWGVPNISNPQLHVTVNNQGDENAVADVVLYEYGPNGETIRKNAFSNLFVEAGGEVVLSDAELEWFPELGDNTFRVLKVALEGVESSVPEDNDYNNSATILVRVGNPEAAGHTAEVDFDFRGDTGSNARWPGLGLGGRAYYLLDVTNRITIEGNVAELTLPDQGVVGYGIINNRGDFSVTAEMPDDLNCGDFVDTNDTVDYRLKASKCEGLVYIPGEHTGKASFSCPKPPTPNTVWVLPEHIEVCPNGAGVCGNYVDIGVNGRLQIEIGHQAGENENLASRVVIQDKYLGDAGNGLVELQVEETIIEPVDLSGGGSAYVTNTFLNGTPGPHIIQVVVTNTGETADRLFDNTASRVLQVGPPPTNFYTVNLRLPPNGAEYGLGEEMYVEVEVRDANGNNVNPSALASLVVDISSGAYGFPLTVVENGDLKAGAYTNSIIVEEPEVMVYAFTWDTSLAFAGGDVQISAQAAPNLPGSGYSEDANTVRLNIPPRNGAVGMTNPDIGTTEPVIYVSENDVDASAPFFSAIYQSSYSYEATGYQIQLSTNESFTDILWGFPDANATEFEEMCPVPSGERSWGFPYSGTEELVEGVTYYWRIRFENLAGAGSWSTGFWFALDFSSTNVNGGQVVTRGLPGGGDVIWTPHVDSKWLQTPYPCPNLVPEVPKPIYTAMDSWSNKMDAVFTVTKDERSTCWVNIHRYWSASSPCAEDGFTQIIQADDNVAPVIKGAGAPYVEYEALEDVPVASSIPVYAEDRCAGTNLPVFVTDETQTNNGLVDIIRTWSAEDYCTNSVEFVQTIHVLNAPFPPDLFISLNYTGSQYGKLRVQVSTNASFDDVEIGVVSHPNREEAYVPGRYLQGLDTVFVRAFIDQDGDELAGPYEAYGLFPDPLVLTAGVNFITIELVDSDSDGDQLPDWWEWTYFNDATGASPTNDPDLDGVTNLEEYELGSDPHSPAGIAYPNAATNVPCRIQAEDYNLGGNNVGYYDTYPGNDYNQYRTDDVDIRLCTMNPGGYAVDMLTLEWLAFTLNVETAGEYEVWYYAGVANDNSRLDFIVNGLNRATTILHKTGEGLVPGWHLAATNLSLQPGRYDLMIKASWHRPVLDFIEIVPSGTYTNRHQRPFGGTPWPVPGPRIEAEDFDDGGPGLAYIDGNCDTTLVYRLGEYVEIESAGTNNYSIRFNSKYEALEYTIEVQTNGVYQPTVYISKESASLVGTLSMYADDALIIDYLNVWVTTPGLDIFTNMALPSFSMEAGIHTMRFERSGGGAVYGLDAFELNLLEEPAYNPGFTAEDIYWQPHSMRGSWLDEQAMVGGDSHQWVMDIDWSRANSKVLYMTTDTTGPWKSVDRGQNWFQVGLNHQVMAGLNIVSDPEDENTVFLLASDNLAADRETKIYTNPELTNIEGVVMEGVYRSTNGGITFEGVYTNDYIFKLGGDRLLIGSDAVVAVNSSGLMLSQDMGDNWTQLPGITDVVVDDLAWVPGSSESQIYLLSELGVGFYNLTNSSYSTLYSNAAMVHTTTVYSYSRDLEPGDTGVLYLASYTGLYKSVNGGVSFDKLTVTDGAYDYTDFSFMNVKASPHDRNVILVSPGPHSNLAAATRTPIISYDGGLSWTLTLDRFLADYFPTSGVEQGEFYREVLRCSGQTMEFDPVVSNNAIVGGPEGLKRTFDLGESWHFTGNGVVGLRAQEVAEVPDHPERMILCAREYGIGVSTNRGRTFRHALSGSGYSADYRDGYVVVMVGEGIGLDGAIETNGENKGVFLLEFSDEYWNYENRPSANNFPPPYPSNQWTRLHDTTQNGFIRFMPTRDSAVFMFREGQNSLFWPDCKEDPTNSVILENVFMGFAPDIPEYFYYLEHNKLTLGFLYANTGVVIPYALSGSTAPLYEPQGSVKDVCIDPFGNLGHMNAIVAAKNALVVYRAYDDSWTTVTDGLPSYEEADVVRVRYDPVHEGVVWCALSYGQDGLHGPGLFVSTDGGYTWEKANGNLKEYDEVSNIDVLSDGTAFISGAGVYTFNPQDVIDGKVPQPRPMSDTDGDLIPDEWEYIYFPNDISVLGGAANDHDHDGATDLEEYRTHISSAVDANGLMIHMDPTNKDTDGDGCPDGVEIWAYGDGSAPGDLCPPQNEWPSGVDWP